MTGAVPTRTLGRTGLEITRLGLGAWAIGGGGWQGGWGLQNDNESIRAIHHAVQAGINWIDTAPAYGLGHSEEIVGRALRAIRDSERPLVFTKCGLAWRDGETTVSNVLAPDAIRRECEDSLRRLGIECLDLLQIHWPTDDGTPVEDSWAAMAELVDAGKARAIGVSNFDLDLLERCERVRHVDTYQPQLNLIARDAAQTFSWCDEHDIGVLVYSPMASGLLTGSFSRSRCDNLPADDWRREHPHFREPNLTRALALVTQLAEIAADVPCTVAELAIAWTLTWPPVTAAIVGARRPEQVDGWLGAAAVDLTPDHVDRIAAVLEETEAGTGPVRPPLAPAPLA